MFLAAMDAPHYAEVQTVSNQFLSQFPWIAQFKHDPTPTFNTQIGIVNEMCRPQDALSDHQYEITTVPFPTKK